MIRNLLILVFAFISLTAHAQFRMVGGAEAPGWSVDSPTDYSATVAFGEDRTGNGYLANQIVANSFRAFTGTGQLYDVIFVGTTGFYEAELTLRERDGDWGSPEGLIMVYDPGSRSKIPACPVAPDGSTNQIIAAIISYNSVIDGNGIFSQTNSGETVPSGMTVGLGDALTLRDDRAIASSDYMFNLERAGVFPSGEHFFMRMHADYDESQIFELSAFSRLLEYRLSGIRQFSIWDLAENTYISRWDPATGVNTASGITLGGEGSIDIYGDSTLILAGSGLYMSDNMITTGGDTVLTTAPSPSLIGGKRVHKKAISDILDGNGFFSPANVGATIPSGMYGVVTDNFRLHAPGVNDPDGEFRFTLSKDGVFPASDNNFLHFHADYDQSQLPGLGSAGDLIRYTDGAATRFRWFTISNNMWFANYDPTGTTVNGSLEFKQDGNIDLFAHGVISIGGSESDGISLTLPLPEISGSVDSVLAKTPAGVVGMIAISDIVSLATPQYAQTYMTGGTNTDVDAGTPERLNATTTGTVTSIIATSDFTNEADGDIQYTGPDNAVIKITANVSILTDDPPNFSFFIAINGTVVPESRTSAAAYLVSHNGTASITFFDADADQNDTYAIFMDTNGTNAVITVVDARLTAEVIK